jgi:hypothetical protein
MNDRLSSLPPFPGGGPEPPLSGPGWGRVLWALGGAGFGFFCGAFGCVSAGAASAFNPEGTGLDALALVALCVGVALATLGGWLGARLG